MAETVAVLPETEVETFALLPLLEIGTVTVLLDPPPVEPPLSPEPLFPPPLLDGLLTVSVPVSVFCNRIICCGVEIGTCHIRPCDRVGARCLDGVGNRDFRTVAFGQLKGGRGGRRDSIAGEDAGVGKRQRRCGVADSDGKALWFRLYRSGCANKTEISYVYMPPYLSHT
ncbi:hypothetical protein SDC9_91420 [bioreactor metagenome]|uniref:Uncharacterized protein n=1 Tax=bioreactor metagenome TaxID=1076179 RepID=A0A644ZUR4_9ZZZZ